MRWLASLALVVPALCFIACGNDSNSIFQEGPQGGSSGSSGAGGAGQGGSSQGGQAGKGGSAGGCGVCDDKVNCTLDVCDADVCTHKVGPNSGATACPTGTACDLTKGCVPVETCASDQECVQKLGSDACKTNLLCDLQKHECTYKTLDTDQDTYPPKVCGGEDCNDADPAINPGRAEVCDGKDNDCDGQVDVGATCSGLLACTSGACTCPSDKACGNDCIDKQTSNQHCGSCFNACPSAATCKQGQCVCAPGATICDGKCVDLNIDPLNCGSCNAGCATGYACENKTCLCKNTPCGGACIDTSADPYNCGGCGKACAWNQVCSGGQCMCPGNVPACGGQCPDYQTDSANCGSCGNVCQNGKTCKNGACMCPTGTAECYGACVNTLTDPNNCGGCGLKCGAGKSCNNGSCSTCAPADLVLLADNSGSMSTTFVGGSQTRWAAMIAAIQAFVAEPQTAAFGTGLQYVAVDSAAVPCTDNTQCTSSGDPFATCDTNTHTCVFFYASMSCEPNDYAKLAVPISLTTSAQATLITNSLNAHTADQSTPMGVALQGVLSAAKTNATNTGHRAYVIVLTDGIPNECPNTATVTDAINAVTPYANGSPKVATYVIGIGSTNDTSGDWQPTAWNQIAAAGGTGTFYQGTSQAQILTSLEAIRNAIGACQ